MPLRRWDWLFSTGYGAGDVNSAERVAERLAERGIDIEEVKAKRAERRSERRAELEALKEEFGRVHITKPKASRPESREVFVVALDYFRRPRHPDPNKSEEHLDKD